MNTISPAMTCRHARSVDTTLADIGSVSRRRLLSFVTLISARSRSMSSHRCHRHSPQRMPVPLSNRYSTARAFALLRMRPSGCRAARSAATINLLTSSCVNASAPTPARPRGAGIDTHGLMLSLPCTTSQPANCLHRLMRLRTVCGESLRLMLIALNHATQLAGVSFSPACSTQRLAHRPAFLE